MFAYPTDMTGVFNTVGKLEKNEVIGAQDVSAEILKNLLPVSIFVLSEFFVPLLSRSWIWKCPIDAKVYPLHNMVE